MNSRPAGIGHNGGPRLQIEPVIDGQSATIMLGEKFMPLFRPFRHKALFGGRGTAKSHTIGTVLPVVAAQDTKRIVCARQFQNSIKDSVKELLENKIKALRLDGPGKYRFYEREIVHEGTDSRFTFIGLDRNPDSAKSLEGADICWVEEARTINSRSMEILIPTIRKPGSEIWWSWNPEFRTDPVDKYFRGSTPPPNSFICRVTIEDNPFFLQTSLPKEMEHMRRGNPARYRHVWLGDYDESFDTKVFSNVKIGRISVPEYCAPRYGMDFGFGRDPSFVVKLYVIEALRTIYIAREQSGCVPLRDLPAMIDSVIDDRSDLIRADSSQPGTIEHLSTEEGFNMVGAVKGPGSVKAGINWLQSYQIVIDPECEKLRDEARLYSWQVDKITKKVLNVPVDAHNHGWDAVRYAIEDVMRNGADTVDDSRGVMRISF